MTDGATIPRPAPAIAKGPASPPRWQLPQPTLLNTVAPCARSAASAEPLIVWLASVEGGTGAGRA